MFDPRELVTQLAFVLVALIAAATLIVYLVPELVGW